MLNRISGLTSDGRLDGAMHNVEAAAKALAIQWFAADHEAKFACGELVIEAIQKLIPNYDLSRILYSQFFFFANHQSATDLEEGAKWFSETAAAATDMRADLCMATPRFERDLYWHVGRAAARSTRMLRSGW